MSRCCGAGKPTIRPVRPPVPSPRGGGSEITTGTIRKQSATEIVPSPLVHGSEQLAPSGFFESDGLQIYYESFGKGEGHSIILVHGWGSDLSANWVASGWVAALQSERQVIALDVRGHGQSDRPLQQDLYSYSTMARDVLNLMDAFGISKADFMGYSLGAIILVHGWGSDLNANWVATGWVEVLQRERQVIALDIRGHGESDRPLQQDLYSYSTMARDVLNLMDAVGISKAAFMGYSMGAFMGAYLLGHHSERFNSMVLGGIGNETEESVAIVDIIAEALRAEDVSNITNPIGIAYRRFIDQDRRNDQAGGEALALAALQMWPEGFPIELGGPGLGDVGIPVLIVNGAVDLPYVNTHQDLAAAIPGAQLVTIPDQDHLGAVTDPLFKDEVLAFLEARRHD